MHDYRKYPLANVDYDYEPFESFLVTSLLRTGMRAMDLGANNGHFTLLMGQHVGSEGRVLALEPDPACMARLRQNVGANGLRNVEMLCCAVSDAPAILPLHLDTGGGGDNRLSIMPGEVRSHIQTCCLTVDHMVHLIGGGAHFIKMDVQGHEMKVLKGATRVLAGCPDLGMLVEYSPLHLQAAGDSGSELIKLLHRNGFLVMALNSIKEQLLTIPPTHVIRDSNLGKDGVVNILALRGLMTKVPHWVSSLIMGTNPDSLDPIEAL